MSGGTRPGNQEKLKMMKVTRIVLALLVLGIFPSMLMAQDGAPKDAAGNLEKEEVAAANMSMGHGLAIGGACLGAGVAAIGGGFAVARIGGNCIESMARQPEAAGAMFAPMIVTAAMVEGGMLFAIVVCLLGVLAI